MPFILRDGTSDLNIFRSINESQFNEYRLPEKFEAEDIIIDIGLHIGSFSYACATKGAGRVLGFEAWEENYRLAKENLKELKVETYPLAVWRSDLEKMPILYFREDQIDQTNKGGGDVLFKNEGVEVKTISLDKVLGEYCQGQPIRLLKLDCEGSEFPILFSCTRLSQVQEICGEYHEIGGEYNEQENIPARAQVGNYQKYTIKELTEFLESQGFAVDSFRHPKSPLGMFFAKRDFCP